MLKYGKNEVPLESHPLDSTKDPSQWWVYSNLYYFGGNDGRKYFSSVHELGLSNLEWNEIMESNTAGGPLPKWGCGMVASQQQLAVIGGFGSAPTGPLQSGAEFIKSTNYPGKGWNNEFHLFSIREGV